ncbi:MAG: glycosyltransferase family 4 protein [Candidatus Krumholzibacteriia bacterium]
MARVLVVASYTPSLINFRGPLLRELKRRGHEVVACSPDPDDVSLAELAAMGIRLSTYPLDRAGFDLVADLRTSRALLAIMRSERPDHVLAYTVKPVVYGCLAARRARVPAIHALITGLGTAFQGRGLRRRALTVVVSALYRRALAGCTRIFFQNPDDRDLFVERRLVDPDRAVVVPGSGIDLDHFAPVPVAVQPPVFLMVTRLIAEKGVREYAEAAARVRSVHPDAVFRLVGYFEDHPGAISRRELDAWSEAGVIDYCGPATDVRPHLAAASVYCLPSYYREGVPRSVLEALAVGRPVITTDAPGCRETVRHGENGFLVPVRDAAALAAAMNRFCVEPQLVSRMGAASRRLAEERFDVHQVNDRMLAVMGLS